MPDFRDSVVQLFYYVYLNAHWVWILHIPPWLWARYVPNTHNSSARAPDFLSKRAQCMNSNFLSFLRGPGQMSHHPGPLMAHKKQTPISSQRLLSSVRTFCMTSPFHMPEFFGHIQNPHEAVLTIIVSTLYSMPSNCRLKPLKNSPRCFCQFLTPDSS
jgi:hypothetical protein